MASAIDEEKIIELQRIFESDSNNDFTPEERFEVMNPSNKTYMRYLIAHKWDLNKAHEAIKATIEWRRTFKPLDFSEVLSLQDGERDAIEHNIYHSGHDKAGRPIIYVKKGEGVERIEVQLRWYTHILEYASKRMLNGAHQCIMIFDMKVMSSVNQPPFSAQIDTLKILSAHYPERMFKAFFTFQPFIFTIVFNVIWPFLEVRQQNKINLLGSDPSSFSSVLLDLIDEDNLETKYGGSREYAFSSDDFRLAFENNVKQ